VRERNRTRDHRLQLVWHTDVSTAATVRADAAFGHVERARIVAPPGSADTPPRTMPLHRWVSTCDAERGAALLSDGLAEAEVEGGRLAVTLLRAIGELSRGDLPERPGHAGWPCEIPLAQCDGVFRARVGLLLHSSWSDGAVEAIEDAADALLLPLTGETWRDLAGGSRTLAGPELVGSGLRASAITLARDGKALLLRARNMTDRSRVGAWTLPGSDKWRVTQCRLDETPLAEPHVTDSRVEFTVSPRALLTLRIERAAG
jgi:alpha-mannosidase